jgi:hypothetical protein
VYPLYFGCGGLLVYRGGGWYLPTYSGVGRKGGNAVVGRLHNYCCAIPPTLKMFYATTPIYPPKIAQKQQM